MADVPAWLSVVALESFSEPIRTKTAADYSNVWPSAKACRVPSENFSIFFFAGKLGVTVGTADWMLWVTRSRTSCIFRRDTRWSVQELREAVAKIVKTACEEQNRELQQSDKSAVEQSDLGGLQMPDERTIHRDRLCSKWGSPMINLRFLWHYSIMHILNSPTATTWAFLRRGKLN